MWAGRAGRTRPPNPGRSVKAGTWRIILAASLVLSGGLLIAGILVERSSESAPASSEPAHAESGEGSETAEQRTAETSEPTHDESTEAVLGINTESNAVLVVVGIASVGLAVAALTITNRPVLGLTAAFAVAAAAFDLAEVARQADASRTGLAVLAAIVALLHLAAAGGAGVGLSHAVASEDPSGVSGA